MCNTVDAGNLKTLEMLGMSGSIEVSGGLTEVDGREDFKNKTALRVRSCHCLHLTYTLEGSDCSTSLILYESSFCVMPSPVVTIILLVNKTAFQNNNGNNCFYFSYGVACVLPAINPRI